MNIRESLSNKNDDVKQFPYNPERFRNFVQILLRLFHDSPAIVIGDCLIREQKSFTDKDIANKLSLSDRQVREALRRLEEDFIVVRDQKNNESSSAQGKSSSDNSNKVTVSSSGSAVNNSSTSVVNLISSENNNNDGTDSKLQQNNRMCQFYYRINPYLPTVVEWQINTITHKLEQDIKDAINLDELLCKRCDAKYSSLEALSLDLDPSDGLFLCRNCNFKLVSVDSAAFRSAAKDKAERARKQLKVLTNSLDLVKDMHVPVFPQYRSKLEKQRNNKVGEVNNISNDVDNSSNNSSVSPLNNDNNTINKSVKDQNIALSDSKQLKTDSTEGISPSNSTTTCISNPSVSKVKFGIKLSNHSTNDKNTGVKVDVQASKSDLKNGSDLHTTNNSNLSECQKVDSVEPTFSISAIKDRTFKISEIDDKIINLMTDGEYLEYDKLLQKHHTSGLFK
ncbi:transcription initiation factor iie [Cryptosporidium ryanae]|uniref:transcription initiation factor iie n=1 Tax=Cryptosporidium ryanae TaxID=515981 RepID=UPI00351A1D98|nr:transcription initiation factor iie [Cryptosporidium ryanae]